MDDAKRDGPYFRLKTQPPYVDRRGWRLVVVLRADTEAAARSIAADKYHHLMDRRVFADSAHCTVEQLTTLPANLSALNGHREVYSG